MKTLVIFFCLFFHLFISAQNLVYIPDENFRKFLKKEFPSCMKGKDKAYLKIDAKKIIKTTTLDISNNNIARLDGIESFINLKFLYCRKNKLSQLPILILPELRILNLDSNQLLSLPDLSNSKGLYQIYCSHNKLISLNGIQNCTKLERIKAADNKLVDVNIFNYIKNIWHIDLRNNNISAFPEIKSETQLTFLNLSYNNIISLNASSIITTKKIGSIYLDHNKIKTVSPLDSFPFIEELSLSYNQLAHFPEIKNSTAIKELELDNNQIKEIPTLPCSFSFNVSNNKIEKITQLKGNYVNISKNPIKTMASKIEVRELYMDSISLSQWPDLRTTQLTLLSASYSNISSLSILPKSLETIKVNHSKFKGAIDIGAFDNLQNLDISFNQITSIMNLDLPYKLKKVNCHGNRFEKAPAKIKNKYDTRMFEEDVWVECDCCL